MNRAVLIIAALLSGFLIADASHARCYICEGLVNEHCANVQPGQTGAEDCLWLDEPFPWPDVCGLGGAFCTEITVNGGGGGGTGGGTGGGGSTCNTTGFCPAECFSCGGGGGRPAV